MLERFKQEFSDRDGVHFNCAGLTPLPRTSTLEIARVLTLFQTQAAFADSELIAVVKRTRETLARFLDADKSQIAFTANCASALSQAALGFPLKSSDSVVTVDQEYSSNFYPWKVACDRSGAKLITVTSATTRLTTDDLIDAIQPGVKLVGVSWVQFQTGAIVDLKRLGDHCHSVGAFLVVDGIQALGQIPFSFRTLPVDFVASGSHKWMCGPLGQGFFAVKPELMQLLSPVVVGGGTFNRFGTFADLNSPMESTAKRFEAGGYNFLSLAGLGASADLIAEVGVAEIAREISSLTQYLRSQLERKDWTSAGLKLATPKNQIGGITSFELPLEWEARLLTRAREDRISIAKRGPFVRTSLHAFCTEREIDQFLTVMEGCKNET